MIVYNTTFHIEDEILQDCLNFLKTEYLPKALVGGLMKNGKLRKVVPMNDEVGNNYAVQFHVNDMEELQLWLNNEGNNLHTEIINRFGNKIVGFSTLLEEIDWEND